jgi:plastocyanin
MIEGRSSGALGAGRFLLLPFAFLAIILAGCASGDAAGQTPVVTTTVDLPKSYRFDPVAITVLAGSTVTWTNSDNFTHNVSLEGSEPLTMAPGASVTHAFPTPGEYAYVCSLHPNDMQGTVRVSAL